MIEHPKITWLSDDVYMLIEDYTYTWQLGRVVFRIIVPKGFESDGATMPKLLKKLIRPDGWHQAPFVLHDAGYNGKGVWNLPEKPQHDFMLPDGVWRSSPTNWSRRDCDRLMNRAMIDANFPEKMVKSIYRAVRIGGLPYWLA